jgi:hypothetical protein
MAKITSEKNHRKALPVPEVDPRLQNKIFSGYSLDTISQCLLRQIMVNPASTIPDLEAVTGLKSAAVRERLQKPEFIAAKNEVLGANETVLKRANLKAILRMERVLEYGADDSAIEAAKVVMSPLLAEIKTKEQGVSVNIPMFNLPTPEQAKEIIAKEQAIEPSAIDTSDNL